MRIRTMFTFMVFLLALALVSLWREAQAETSGKYQKTFENYVVPEVTLVNQNGRKVRLNALLISKRPVLVDFIFTTCTTICPLLSIGFSDFQKKLGPEADSIQLISISIDPEHDTPKAMKAYLQRYDARAGWDFLTGSREDIEKVLKAFGAYTPDKMSHRS